jgi:TolB protein
MISWFTLVSAQTRVYIDIDQVGGYQFPLALPRFAGETSDAELGQQVRTVLRSDLELSGIFRFIDPAAYIDEAPEAPDRLRYQNWTTIGAMGVIAGRVQRPGAAQIRLELFLHDVAQQHLRFAGKEYTGAREQYREMAHRFSDLVFREFTGEDGSFNTQVVCVRPRGAGSRSKDIVLMDYDGYGVKPLVADGALNVTPVLSPDGSILAYTSYRSGSPQVYLRNLASGTDERITMGEGLTLAGSWSPDGRYLALSHSVDGNSDIYLYDVRGKRTTRLTTDWAIDVSPSFSPDGKRLVFTSDRSGTPQLYLTNIGGSPPVRLTYEGDYNTDPVWSPRDETIAFAGRTNGRGLDIFTIRADGRRLQRLTNGGGKNDAPTWAPNGRFVMYNSSRGGDGQRRLMRENGQWDRALPVNTVCVSPQWVARTGF